MPGVDEAEPEAAELARELASRAPAPAVWANVRTGTAGWTDPTLIRSGRFYPSGLSRAAERLGFYASHFSLVEVDATYYSLMPPENAYRWVQSTPDEFRFDIKAHPVFTSHPIDVGRLPSDLKREANQAGFERRAYADRLPPELVAEIERRFLALVEPVHEAGKLGCVMAQFPPWFRATRGNARRLEALAERLGDIPVSIEFRHPSWLEPERRARVFDLLESHELIFVGVDEPDVPGGGVPPVVHVTNPHLAVVRLHGKNAEAWRRRGASVQERFDYVYAPEELRAWVEPVRRLSSEAAQVHVVFNNCVHDYAVVNAKGLAVLLSETA